MSVKFSSRATSLGVEMEHFGSSPRGVTEKKSVACFFFYFSNETRNVASSFPDT